MKNTVYINGNEVEIGSEKNLLELIRKTNIHIPTFCYHSDLSTYGACRMCIVDIEGRGILASCSTMPTPGMKIKTHTEEIRGIRKMAVELILANHDQSCPTCQRSDSCGLRKISAQLGIDKVRFEKPEFNKPKDKSSPSLVRDPDKCILCGDCVRYCKEIQGIGVLDFAYRGAQSKVTPAFNADLGNVECVNCGGCASVCPTGAIVSNGQANDVWKALNDPSKKVVVQIAPACRTAISEMFTNKSGEISTGKMVSALKLLGFNMVFDTSYAADLTAIEETHEFLKRKEQNSKLPIFTSCCPGWVKYAEQYYPKLLGNLSSCRSPQQMFGTLLKKQLSKNIDRKDLVVVSIMPCTAKKFEAKRDEFAVDGNPDVDYVLTTFELGQMIKEAGIDFEKLQSSAMDMPYGIASGAGVLFGTSGGVSEAVIRYASKFTNLPVKDLDFNKLRGVDGIREARVKLGDQEIKVALVHGLKNAGKIASMVENNEVDFDIIEVMACPGGCVGGAGQPVVTSKDTLVARKASLHKIDDESSLKSAGDNSTLDKEVHVDLKDVNLHKMLHTTYKERKRISDDGIKIVEGAAPLVNVEVCVGTGCFLKGSQEILKNLLEMVDSEKLENDISVKATFCMEKCGEGPNVKINGTIFNNLSVSDLQEKIKREVYEHKNRH